MRPPLYCRVSIRISRHSFRLKTNQLNPDLFISINEFKNKGNAPVSRKDVNAVSSEIPNTGARHKNCNKQPKYFLRRQVL